MTIVTEPLSQGLQVELHRIPHPYRSMLAVCSDLDRTPDRQSYFDVMRFLNTTAPTSMGQGVGLEVGNSIYFDMPPGQLSYWNTDSAGREMFRTLIRSGHVDCLHSFGDLATSRDDARRAMDELQRHDCRLSVWVDHSVAPSNFGADITCGYGDLTGHPAYHADLTVAHGIRYVWRGRVTSVIGQDVPTNLEGVWVSRHPFASARTIGKEMTKEALARWGNRKYSMHGANRVLRTSQLRDGQPIYEFLRENPHWGGVSSCETGEGIGLVLTTAMLSRLTQRQGICILYTHLGKTLGHGSPLPPLAIAGFRRLARANQDRRVLVTTTARMLDFLAVRDSLEYSFEQCGAKLIIHLTQNSKACHLAPRLTARTAQGISFTVAGWPGEVILHVEGVGPIACEQHNDEHTTCVTVPWQRLEFPESF